MIKNLLNFTLALFSSIVLIDRPVNPISEEQTDFQAVYSMGGSCLEIINPNTGAVSLSFNVDTICQGESMDFCLTTSGCDNDVNIESFSGNLGQVIVTPPSSPMDNCISYTAPANFVGSDSFTLEVTNTDNDGNVETTVLVELTFVVADPQNNTTVSPPQELCSPATSAILEAINPDPIVGGYWVILQGGGTINDVTNPTIEVTDIPFGENIYMWRQDYPCQSTFDLTIVNVYDGEAPVANAGPDVELCSFEDSYVMQANDPLFSATGTWEITFGNATINDINDPNALVTNIGIGENIFEWNIGNGPCPGGETVSQMIIYVYDQNTPDADAGEDIELCASTASTNSAVTNALDLDPYEPAAGEWLLVQGFGIVDDNDDNVTDIDDLEIGTNQFTWTVDNGVCPGFPQVDTLEIRVYDPNHAFPDAGEDVEYCAPISVHQLVGSVPDDPAVGTWTVTNGSGSFSDDNDPNATVTNLAIGVNTYRWTIYNGPCSDDTFFDEVTVIVYDSNTGTASAGDDMEFCDDTFTNYVMDASGFTPPATGIWTLISPSNINVEDILSDINDPNAVLSGISPEEYVFQWTIDNGPCDAGENSDQVSMSMYPSGQVNADAGEDTELCTPITTFSLQGNAPISPGIGTWTLVSGQGAILNENDPNTTVSNLGIGVNIFQWTIDNGACGGPENSSQVTITVFNLNNEPANAGTDIEICSDPNNIPAIGLSASETSGPAVGEWSIINGSGTFSDINDPNASFTSDNTGTVVLEWAIDNGVCDVVSNTDQVNLFIFSDEESPANAGLDFDICSDQLNAFLNANTPSDPASGTWTVVQGAGVFADDSDPNTSVSGFDNGTNTYRWTVDNGACVPSFTFDDIILTVYDVDVPIANAGEDLEICSNFGPVVLDATQFQAPATGEWQVISGSGTFSNSNDPNSLVSDWSIGDNVYEWVVNNGPCSGGSIGDQIVITVFDINADQSNAGTDQELCLPQTATTLSANTPSSPSTGFWSVISGSGLFADDTNPNTTVSGLSVGNNTFRWTIDNGACAAIFSEDDVTISLFGDGLNTANAGPDQDFCEPISSTTMSANTPDAPSSGNWTLVSGTGDINDPTDPNTVITNIQQGVNIFQWTVDGGPCPSGDDSDLVTINIFDDNHPEADAGSDIEICTPENSTQLNGSVPIAPATGTWIQVSGPNTSSFDPGNNASMVTNLIPGTYVFQWQIDNGPCSLLPLTDQVVIEVFDENAPLPNAGLDIELCTPNSSTTLSANSAVGAGLGEWTIVQGGGSFSDINDPSANVTNIPVGENVYQWSIDNSDCGFGNLVDNVSVFLFDENSPDANAGDDQFLCSPTSETFVVGNVPLDPATVQWELVSGSGTPTDPESTTTQITGLSIGENIFRYSIFNGPCPNGVTEDFISIFVFDSGAPQAFAGDDIEICSPTSTVTMAADPAINPGVGTWVQISGPNSGIISNDNSPNTSIGGLQIGTYVFEWSLDYATCGSQSDQVTITIFDSTLENADAGPDQELCSPDNFTTLDANDAASPAYGTWGIVQGSVSFNDINDPNTSISNVAVGTNILVWNVYNGNCTAPENSTDTVNITLYPSSLPSAFAGIDQEFCSTTDNPLTVQMTGLSVPNPGIGTWSVISGSGIFDDINDPNSQVTGVSVGISEYQWTVDYGACSAETSDNVIIQVFDANQEAADAGPDQEFCTPIPLVQLNANTPTSPATGTWTSIVGGAVISDPTDPNATLTNLTLPGVYIWRWSISNGPCNPGSTNDLVTIFVYDEAAPDATVSDDQELCLPIANTNLSGNLPVFPAIGTWTQISGFVSINNTNNPNSPVSNLSVGVNCFVWEIYNGPCANNGSRDTLCISVFDPDSPISDAGPDQEICSTSSTISLAASIPISPSLGTWSQTQGITADISDINDPNAIVTNLSVGVNQFQWTVYNGPCENGITSDVVNIYVFDVDQSPATCGPDQNLCLPVNSTNLSGNSLTSPAFGQWSVCSGGGTITDIGNPTSLVTDLAIGENCFIWTVNNGPCPDAVTQDTLIINVFDNQAALAATIPDIQECAPVSSITIEGNAALNATTGFWTQLDGNSVITDPTQNVTDITNLNVGTYVFEWTLDNGPCGISSDSLIVEIFDPSGINADAGPNQSFCTPTNSTFLEGSTLIPPATGQWEVLVGQGTVVDPSNPESEIVNLTVGEIICSWTVDNGPCGGVTTDFVSIFIYDESAPNADAGADQEFCLPIDNTSMAALPATFPAIGQWTLFQGGGDIGNINSPDSPIINIPVGENIFVWSVDNGPCPSGITTDTVSVFIFPDEFSLADAGLDQQFCTPQDSSIMAALIPDVPSVGTWTLIGGSASIVDNNDPTTEIFQLGIGTNEFSWQVYHGPCNPETSLDIMEILIYDENHPPADAGPDQEHCLPDNDITMSATSTSDPAIGEWSIANGGGTILAPNDPLTGVTGIPVGNNLFVWSVDNGPCENPITRDTVCIKIFSDDSALANAGADIDLCGLSQTSLNATVPDAPSTGTWQVVSGPSSFSFDNVNDPQAEFSALVVGQYELAWNVYNGPCIENSTSSDTVLVNVFDLNQEPAVAGDTLEFCWPIDTVFLNASLTNFPSVGEWTVNGAGDISDINDPLAYLTNLSIGNYTLNWSVDNGPCGNSSDDLVLNIFDPNNTLPDAGPDQQICTSEGGTTLAVMAGNIPLTPSSGTWQVVFGSTPIISDINDPSANITNIGYGETQLVWSFYNGPCEPEFTTDTMSIFHFDSDISPDAGPTQEYCGLETDSIQLQGNATIGNTAIGTWSVTALPIGVPSPTIIDIHNESTFVTDLFLGIYEFTWTIDNGFCGIDSSSVSVIFYDPDLPTANAGSDEEVCEDEFIPFNLNGNTVMPPVTVQWDVLIGNPEIDLGALNTPDPLVSWLGELPEPLTTIENSFVYTVDNGVCGNSVDTVTYTLADCLTIEIPDAFSPNGDFVNDTWFIPNLNKYPQNNMKIFNRWGTLLYEKDNYQGDWNGISEHSATIGTELPVGTYFYILDLGNGTPVFEGFVYLKR